MEFALVTPASAAIWTPYCGRAPAPDALWARWNLDPILLAIFGVALLVMIWRTHGQDRALRAVALAVLAVSFVSPLCALASALFAARTVHHLLLICIAAPLLAWSGPRLAPGSLTASTLVQTALFWLWHAPAAYGAALSNDALYWVMQLSLLGSAIWFWAAVRSASAPSAVAGLLVAMVQMGLLGAVITFSSQVLYAPHALSTTPWGISALEDQQAAGLIMWAPAAAIYMGAGLAILARWIGPDRPVPE